MADLPIRVLVVEDNPEDYQILKVMFSKIRHRSYVPENVKTYQEAMECLRRREHDAYLVDYKLGPDSGLEFLREAIQKEKCAAPIILLTGFGDHELDLEAMGLGAADFLNKNKLDPDVLERSIRYALERKRAEENRLRLAAVVETSNDAIYVLTEDGAVVSWNPGAERIYGYKPHEIGGKDVSVILTPGREEEFKRLIGTVRKGEAVANFTTAHQSKDGKSILVSMTLSPILDKSGKVTRASVIARDITESEKAKATKEMLQAERDQLLERLQLQMERMPVACILNDSHFNFTYWNPAAEKMFGYSFREVEGKHPKGTIVSSVSWPSVEILFNRLAQGDMTAQGEIFENMHKGGQTLYCEWYNTPLQDPDGNFTGIMSMAIDITERQKAAEVQSQLAAILQQTTDAVIGTDLEDRIFSWNRGAEIMLGYEFGEVVGKTVNFLAPKDHQDEMLKMREISTRGESLSNFETVRVKKNGEMVDVSVTLSPIRDSKGKIVGVSAITRDITEQKKAQESLKKNEEQFRLAEKMNAIGRLAGGVAHDFNNLLSVIGGNAEFLLSSMEQDSPHREEVGEIQKATRRGAELTKQLLVFGQKQISQPQPVNLNDLSAEMNKMLKRIIEATIDLAIIQDKTISPILADPGQMQQVILNLVLNAQDAMPKGGHLIVETKSIRADDLEDEQKNSIPRGDYVRLSVTDTGTGMSPEIQKKIFEPFFTTKAGKGTGLGLASVYGIVTKWGGQIFVHSTLGMGSTFSIYFPAMVSTEKSESKPKQAALIPLGSETILVAEDEAPVRKILVRTLEKYGYRVLSAMNGVEAVQVAWNYKEPIQLLLTDTVMPKMNGKELADELRKSRPKIKVIFVSGYPREVLSQQGIIDPAIHLIQKPFELDDLAHQVRKILDEK
jgi:two-component system, cell cycle sensor histidine kinase and response regulator CckA